MAKKTSKKVVATEETAVMVETSIPDVKETETKTVETATPVVKEKKKRKTTKKDAGETVKEEVETVKEEEVETVKAEVVTTTVEGEGETTIKKTRRVIKKEEVAKSLEGLVLDLMATTQLDKGLKKRVSKSYGDVVKVLKLGSNGSKKTRDVSNSGFMKPVSVTEPMRKFLGLGDNELTRRLDITKTLCDYIKTHNLQNPQDRRIIVPDDKLRQLLGLGQDESLTYYSIQQKLKDLIIKV